MCSIIRVGERLHKVLWQIDLAHWTQVSDRCPLGYLFVVSNGYRALLTNALMPIKQYTVFKYLHQLSLNIGSNNFIRIPSSHLMHKTSNERHSTHTPYAKTDVLQTL